MIFPATSLIVIVLSIFIEDNANEDINMFYIIYFFTGTKFLH
jgi:hypothetical protein